MSFKKIAKKRNNKNQLQQTPKLDNTNTNLVKNTPSFKNRLLDNNADSLNSINIWLNFFASSWLASGLLIQKLSMYSMILIPLLLFFVVFSKKEYQGRDLSAKFKFIPTPFLFIIVVLYSAYFEYVYSKPYLSLILLLALVIMIIQGEWKEDKSRNSIFKIIVFGGLVLVQVLCLSILGLFSQFDREITLNDLSFLLLGLIPACIISARQYLLDSPLLHKLGMQYEYCPDSLYPDKKRPGGIARLINGLIVLGVGIPAILLPTNLLPKTMFIVTIAFIYIPRIATDIQQRNASLEQRVVRLTQFTTFVIILAYSGAFLSRYFG